MTDPLQDFQMMGLVGLNPHAPSPTPSPSPSPDSSPRHGHSTSRGHSTDTKQGCSVNEEPDRGKEYDPTKQKRCIKCGQWRDRWGPNKGFGANPSAADGLQSICFGCKNEMNNKARDRNVVARLRHHIGTRCLTQLGKAAPKGFTRDLEKYLGYRVVKLAQYLGKELRTREGPGRKLREALMEGYHVDHIRPLSSYRVVVERGPNSWEIDWEEFRRCWAMENLRAIPAAENLAKGAKYNTNDPF